MDFRLLTLNHAALTTNPLAPYNIVPDSLISNNISIDGQTWLLSDTIPIANDSIPEYACISYKWGLERQTNTLFPSMNMSTHTIPSLITAIRSQESYTNFWTDVFCVPPENGSARQATLENLGWIYAHAAEVIVVLGRETFDVLQDMIRDRIVSEANLQVLESDQWVASVWTYQELVNAGTVRFVSEQQQYTDDLDTNTEPPSVDVPEFLNALGHGLENYRKSQELDSFAMITRFPNLDVLERVLADWMMGFYTNYSALTIFSNVCTKHNNVAANYYYAIFGALSHSPQQLVWPADQMDETLAEKMMKICESKSDFSYIYSVAQRDTDPKRRWRPLATPLPADGEGAPSILRPLIVWHYWGEAQSGTYNDNGELWLHHMTIMHDTSPGRMSSDARTAIAQWLGKLDSPDADDEAVLAKLVHAAFRAAGFEGDAEPIVVSDGLVFVLQPVDPARISDIIISNEIRFSQGAPGLVRFLDGDEEKRYSPCVFIGSIKRLLEPGDSVLL